MMAIFWYYAAVIGGGLLFAAGAWCWIELRHIFKEIRDEGPW